MAHVLGAWSLSSHVAHLPQEGFSLPTPLPTSGLSAAFHPCRGLGAVVGRAGVGCAHTVSHRVGTQGTCEGLYLPCKCPYAQGSMTLNS